MIWLLDTNICISLMRSPSAGLLNRFRQVEMADIRLCSVVRAELLFGAYRSQRREANLHIVGEFVGRLGSLPFDDLCAEHYARVRSELAAMGNLIGPNDLLIASIALAHDVTLVTHNVAEFARVPGLLIEDWEV